MPIVEISTLINWLITGAIAMLFGTLSAWVTYRFERRRDMVSWKNEKEKLQLQFENDKALIKLQYKQKMEEDTLQRENQKNLQLRDELLKGIDNPDDVINGLRKVKEMILEEKGRSRFMAPIEMAALPLLIHIEEIINGNKGDE